MPKLDTSKPAPKRRLEVKIVTSCPVDVAKLRDELADEEISLLHKAFDDATARLTAERDAAKQLAYDESDLRGSMEKRVVALIDELDASKTTLNELASKVDAMADNEDSVRVVATAEEHRSRRVAGAAFRQVAGMIRALGKEQP